MTQELDLTGIENKNEFYSDHYFAALFSENAEDWISSWGKKELKSAKTQRDGAEEAEKAPTLKKPWEQLKALQPTFQRARKYYDDHKLTRSYLATIADFAGYFLAALGYRQGEPEDSVVTNERGSQVQLFRRFERQEEGGQSLPWVTVVLAAAYNAGEEDGPNSILEQYPFTVPPVPSVYAASKEIFLAAERREPTQREFNFDLNHTAEQSATQRLAERLHQQDQKGSSLGDYLYLPGKGDQRQKKGAAGSLKPINIEELAARLFFPEDGSKGPRFILVIGDKQVALLDRNKWSDKRCILFDLEEIFNRHEESNYKSVAVLLHYTSLLPDSGEAALLDKLEENSQKHAQGVSEDLKYALRESVEALGNEVLRYYRNHPEALKRVWQERRDHKLAAETAPPVDSDGVQASEKSEVIINAAPAPFDQEIDAQELSTQCLRYMYRLLFVLFIESRPKLGYAPINQCEAYRQGYSMEALRDIVDAARQERLADDESFFLFDSLQKLFNLVYNGYPANEAEFSALAKRQESRTEASLSYAFYLAPLKAHVFDPTRTDLVEHARLRNCVMRRIIELMSTTRGKTEKGRVNRSRVRRISYANLGINQLGAVYEALLSYRGFIAAEELYEVNKAGETFDELKVAYFVTQEELKNYSDEEIVRYEENRPERGEVKDSPRAYPKGTFIYRMTGREREKSASYYTPECLTKCLVHYALEEALRDKSADEILRLTVCEPAMGSAAFLNETVNQLAEAYLTKKIQELKGREEELSELTAEARAQKLQQIKTFIADRNVYGVDLNPVAVELAEISLWLNTIHSGGFVPWFGTQLMCGNSLIGARRQVFSEKDLRTKSKKDQWHAKEPRRVPLGQVRKPDEFYHFLIGDPGMCDYNDKVIKSLKPEQIKRINAWRKDFTKEFKPEEIVQLRVICDKIDELWRQQVENRRKLESQTRDYIDVFGRKPTQEELDARRRQTTIRQKDAILDQLYKTKDARDAGPYARLKFVMDYWCALWFWPIEHADKLPTRAQFLFDVQMLVCGVVSAKDKNDQVQQKLWGKDEQQLTNEWIDKNAGSIVDIPKMRHDHERLNVVAQVAERMRFLHWELEFADVFDARGGFDLVIGNPPWIKVRWNEQSVLADKHPEFAIRNLSATQTTQMREGVLEDVDTYRIYIAEYESSAGTTAFLNAYQNYPLLKGMQTNLYICFLPQAWTFANNFGVSAFVHPLSVYNDSKGGELREIIYSRVRKHLMFVNARGLFPEVHRHTAFSLNVYGGQLPTPDFYVINNLYDPSTIEDCETGSYEGATPGIKDRFGNFNITGHPKRRLHITRKELEIFAKVFDEEGVDWRQTKLPVLHSQELLGVLRCFVAAPQKIAQLGDDSIFMTCCFDETNDQKAGVFYAEKKGDFIVCEFPATLEESIYSSPFIKHLNPVAASAKRYYKVNSDYIPVDLTNIPEDYRVRTKYRPTLPMEKYREAIPSSKFGKCTDFYRIVNRAFVSSDLERTLTCAIAPRAIAHVNTVFSAYIKNCMDMCSLAGCMASLPYDFLVKCSNKAFLVKSNYLLFPIYSGESHHAIVTRTLMLNCVTNHFDDLWQECWRDDYSLDAWTKDDPRLKPERFTSLTKDWSWNTPLRTDYERRQALVELDVLTAKVLGMTLEELKTIYRFQFDVLQKNEQETWYDARGRIAFTINGSLRGVGYSRAEFENSMRDAAPGTIFHRTILDETLPSENDEPVERVIEYEAPFDTCDREADYETAWRVFTERGL
ncbi:MAG: class I SAM-dependent DNA methyltransferase [Planctomycetia bacterium]|nr:class I SAM-dependent DNA methyltransferase [Planctomycetia bacterium]